MRRGLYPIPANQPGFRVRTTRLHGALEAVEAGSSLSRTDSGTGAEAASATLVVSITRTDSCAGTDAIADRVIVRVESGSGVDSSTLIAVVGGSDTGAGSETGGISVPITATDSASGTETSSLVASVSKTDSGSGAEGTSVLVATVSATDSGSGVDSSTLAASVTVADTSTGSDASSRAVSISSVDTGAGSEASSLVAVYARTDSGSGSETVALVYALTDSGSGSEVAALAATIPVTDSSSGVDSSALVAIVTATDSATDVEAGSASVGVGAVAPMILVPGGTNTSLLIEAIPAVPRGEPKRQTQILHAFEPSQDAAKTASDSATGLDSSSLDTHAPPVLGVLTRGQTNQGGVLRPIPEPELHKDEPGASKRFFLYEQRPRTVTESGVGADVTSLARPITDSGAGTDSALLLVSLALSDTGTGVDVTSPSGTPYPVLISTSDSGAGSESYRDRLFGAADELEGLDSADAAWILVYAPDNVLALTAEGGGGTLTLTAQAQGTMDLLPSAEGTLALTAESEDSGLTNIPIDWEPQ